MSKRKSFLLTLAIFCIAMPPVMYLVNYFLDFELQPASYFITPLLTACIFYFTSNKKAKTK
ncbi:hypothetical protein KRX57_03675 [Weeksellaceae bacterium TAE3-ERU29]|nr:hypothetical protein [Weeksellaceae bacterium TAE3-ERU29]